MRPRGGHLNWRTGRLRHGAEDRRAGHLRRASVLVGVAVLVAGCGTVQPVSRAPTSRGLRTALKGSSRALVALHTQASRLLAGGEPAFRARLGGLHGMPVVVNIWASWCPPCRAEFPLFQTASVRFGRHIAFLGVDTLDQAANARSFLSKFPVSYPSYEDNSGAISRSLVPAQGVPITVFLAPDGKVSYFHQGGYQTESQLVGDVRRYAEHA